MRRGIKLSTFIHSVILAFPSYLRLLQTDHLRDRSFLLVRLAMAAGSSLPTVIMASASTAVEGVDLELALDYEEEDENHHQMDAGPSFNVLSSSSSLCSSGSSSLHLRGIRQVWRIRRQPKSQRKWRTPILQSRASRHHAPLFLLLILSSRASSSSSRPYRL